MDLVVVSIQAYVGVRFVMGIVDAWENTTGNLYRGSFEEALQQLLEEEELLGIPASSAEAFMTAYNWVATVSVITCLLSISVVALGGARDSVDYTVQGLSKVCLGKARGAANPLFVKVLGEVEVERLVGLTREVWLSARGVITRGHVNKPLRKFL